MQDVSYIKKIGIFIFSLLGFTVNSLACPISGDYDLKWAKQNNEQDSKSEFVKISSAGAAPREVLSGMQAVADTDCRFDIRKPFHSVYFLSFNAEQYLGLGWSKEYEQRDISCFGNDLGFICKKKMNTALGFNCPPAVYSEEKLLSYEAKLLCSTRQTEKDAMRAMRIELLSGKELTGVGGSVGLFFLERSDKK
jgi:hypothetical protein